MTPTQTRDALVREMNELADQIASAGINSFSHRVLLLANRLAALPVGDGEPVKYPDDIGVWRTAKELSARCDELAKRLVHAAPPPPAVPAGWTSVDERMPEEGQTCLVYSKQSWEKEPSIKIDTWQEQHESPLSFSSATVPIGLGWDEHDDFYDVIAWMSLPARPDAPSGEKGT